MPRVREIEDDEGDPVLQEIFATERERYGGLLNVAFGVEAQGLCEVPVALLPARGRT